MMKQSSTMSSSTLFSMKGERVPRVNEESSEEALDYLPPDSIVHRQWQRSNRNSHQSPSIMQSNCNSHRGDWDRWLVTALIGVSVGVVGFLLHQLTYFLTVTKWHWALALSEESWFLCWLFVLFSGLLLLIPATWVVVYLRPSAGGSGMPELIGFLNGSRIRHIFNIKTFGVKFVSTILAVASGLPVGPEGPMIHMGALMGSGLSQLRSTTLGFSVSGVERLRNTQDHRDFISAGAAAGIASVFGAPVGGLLFVMEEMASFWSHTLALRVFLCCSLSTFTTTLLRSTINSDFSLNQEKPIGQLVSEKLVLFRVHIPKEINVIAIGPAIVMGLIGGLVGALFVNSNLALNKWRMDGQSGREPQRSSRLLKLLEPMVVLVVFLSVVLVLPTLFQCQPIECFEANEQTILDNDQICRLPHDHYCFGLDDDAEGDLAFEKNVNAFGHCHFTRSMSDDLNFTLINGSYSQLASLILSDQETTLRHLYSRNTNLQFDTLPLLVYTIVYLVGACTATGLSVSSGLMLPLLTIGALYGRTLGQMGLSFFDELTVHDWMDPGAMALLGSVSFLAGVTRLTISLTVIVLEMTDDVDFLLLVMITVLVAKVVADKLSPAIYQGLLDLKRIPHLNYVSLPRAPEGGRFHLRNFEARHAMHEPVVSVNRVDSSSRLASLLIHTRHGAFPVVKEKNFVGTISRFELQSILTAFSDSDLFNDTGVHRPSLPLDNLNELVDDIKNKMTLETEAKLSRLADSAARIDVDLKDYINLSAVSVSTHFSLERTYSLFRQLGLRHLVVVDSYNRVAGMITRKDLTTTTLERRLAAVPREILHP